MLRHLFLAAVAIGLTLASISTVEAYGRDYYNHVARHAYYDGYGQGPYGRYGYGSAIQYGDVSRGFGYGPYGYGFGSYNNGFYPPNNNYGQTYNRYGTVDDFGSPYGYSYNPYGFGVYSSY